MYRDLTHITHQRTQVQAQILKEISELLNEVGRLLATGAGADEIYDLMYEEDALVVGDGDLIGMRGRAALVPALEALINGAFSPRPQCRYVLHEPAVLDGNAATTLVEFQVRPDEGRGELQIHRALYGWARTDGKWRVRVETYSVVNA